MPWIGLALTLVWNYLQHRRHRSTLCQVTRRALPWWAVVVAWCGLSGWLLPHIRNGYERDR